jgi:glycine cleavage system transcriptional repressor
MPHYAITAVGADRPGIVAALTSVFLENGCNIEDSAMTILRGHFAMMLVVDAPRGVSAAKIKGALNEPASALDLMVAVRPLADLLGGAGSTAGGAYTVAVHGADHPGIVHGVASLLAASGVNIVDMSTRVVGDPGEHVYAMVMEVDLPAGLDPDELSRQLSELAEGLDVTCSLHPSEADIL